MPSGKINARAKVTPKAARVSAHVEAADLGLTDAAALHRALHLHDVAARERSAPGSTSSAQADGTLAVRGNTQVSDLRTVDNALKQDFIKWKDLRVADIRYRSAPASLRIGNVTALEPYVRMIIAPDRTLNISEVLTRPGRRQPSPPPRASHRPARVARNSPRARAANGRGRALGAAAAAGRRCHAVPHVDRHRQVRQWLRQLCGPVDQAELRDRHPDPRRHGDRAVVRSASRAKVQLDGKVDRYSPMQIAGEVNLLSAALYTDITMSFKDLDLTVVNPYSGHFAGYKIDKGKLSVDVTYKIEQRKLTATQHFVVDQLELGDRVDSPDAVHLPLKLAVALLKDRNGVIDLDLPMNGSLDDPTFRIGPILWKIFVNLIVKAATAPFALLGHLFGGGEHMNIVEFAARQRGARSSPRGISSPRSSRRSRNGRSSTSTCRSCTPGHRPPADGGRAAAPGAAGARAGHPCGQASTRTPRASWRSPIPQKHFKLLLEQYQADLGKDAPLPPTAVAVQQAKRKETPPYDPAIADLNAALIDHIQVPDSDLEALGKQRAQAIQDALVSGGAGRAVARVHRQRAAQAGFRRQGEGRNGGEVSVRRIPPMESQHESAAFSRVARVP